MICKLYKFLRNICSQIIIGTIIQLGGANKDVEIDDSLMNHLYYFMWRLWNDVNRVEVLLVIYQCYYLPVLFTNFILDEIGKYYPADD